MNNVLDTFHNVEIFDSDVYISDYTNQTNNVRKLEFTTIQPTDISSFYLKNKQGIVIYGINFERNPSFSKGHKMCECLFTPAKSNGKPWVLLLEMKYCQKEGNIDDDSSDALVQLNTSYNYLVKKAVLDIANDKIYFVISIPDFTSKEPFTNFRLTQNDLLKSIDVRKITLYARNNVVAATPNYLFEIKRNIHDNG